MARSCGVALSLYTTLILDSLFKMGKASFSNNNFLKLSNKYVYSSDSSLLIINSSHIVGMGFPTRSLIVQYYEAVHDMIDMHVQREKEFDEDHPTEQVKRDKKMEDYLNRMDSGSNVIDMFGSNPPSTKIH